MRGLEVAKRLIGTAEVLIECFGTGTRSARTTLP